MKQFKKNILKSDFTTKIQRCTAIGYGYLNTADVFMNEPYTNSYYSIEKWSTNTTQTFEIVSLKLNGVEFGASQSITINSPGDLITGLGLDETSDENGDYIYSITINPPGDLMLGTGLDGVTLFVMNVNDWINSIPGVLSSGFKFYDNMTAGDIPTFSSTFDITLKRTSIHPFGTDVRYYKFHKLSTPNIDGKIVGLAVLGSSNYSTTNIYHEWKRYDF